LAYQYFLSIFEMKNDALEEIKDPKGDRAIKTVPPPPRRPLTSSQLFPSAK
jgi:hypothetical protein